MQLNVTGPSIVSSRHLSMTRGSSPGLKIALALFPNAASSLTASLGNSGNTLSWFRFIPESFTSASDVRRTSLASSASCRGTLLHSSRCSLRTPRRAMVYWLRRRLVDSDRLTTKIDTRALHEAASCSSYRNHTSWRRSCAMACVVASDSTSTALITLSDPVDDLAILFVVGDELRWLVLDKVVTVNLNIVLSYGTFGPVELFAELTGPTLLCHRVLHVLSGQCTDNSLVTSATKPTLLGPTCLGFLLQLTLTELFLQGAWPFDRLVLGVAIIVRIKSLR